MIPKPYRLNLSKTTLHGSVKRGSFYLIISESSSHSRYGVRVAKKIDRRAVVRNRFRRQIVQHLFQHQNGTRPLSVLVILKRKPSPEEMNLLYADLNQILSSS